MTRLDVIGIICGIFLIAIAVFGIIFSIQEIISVGDFSKIPMKEWTNLTLWAYILLFHLSLIVKTPRHIIKINN